MEKNLQFQNRSITYWLEGSGKPVMLVHGFAEDHRVWENQVKHLQKYFQLILPDLPGSGKSELLDDVSMENMASVLKAILDKESISKVAMVGHSMGGYVTLAFAEKYADYLNCFCLFHSTAYPDNDEKKQVRAKAIEFMKRNGVEEFLKTSTPNLFMKDALGNLDKDRQAMVIKVLEDYRELDGNALVAYYQAMMNRPDRTHVLKTFTKPILYLLGKHDTAVPYQQGLDQTRLAGNVDVHTLNNSGHMGMWEEPLESNRILEDFLKTKAT
jgi:pimeloyl-ACP methyl ester carboxylesterase